MHGEIGGYVLKFACGLLANKEAQSYAWVFQVLKERIFNLFGPHLSPRNVIIDYEHSIIIGLQQEFPCIEIYGCFFHFTKAVWRKIQELGLAGGYRNNEQLRELVRKIMALGFLPVIFVPHAYRLLRNDPATVQLIELNEAVAVFLHYFENTWLNEQGTFPPPLWNVHLRPMEFRTNNHVESFHRRWNKAVNEQHPSLWLFLRVLKNEQRLHEIVVRNAFNGVRPPIRRRKWRQFEQRIINLRDELRNRQRTVVDYWRAISHAVLDFM